MKVNSEKWYLAVLLTLFLSACGGSGSNDIKAPIVPVTPVVPVQATPSDIIAAAKNYTAPQLKAAALELANTLYIGNEESFDITIEAAQKTINLISLDGINNPPMLLNFPFQLTEIADASGNVNATFACIIEGAVTVVGQLNAEQQGKLSMTFTACNNGAQSRGVNGRAAVNINTMTDDTKNFEMYYDNFSYLSGDTPFVVSGYFGFQYTDFPSENRFVRTRDIIAHLNTEQQSIFLETIIVTESKSPFSSFEISGDIYLFDEGKSTFSSTNLSNVLPASRTGRLELNSNNLVMFEFEDPYIRYSQDTNNDGAFDIGAYFADPNDIAVRNVSSAELVAIADMSRPPLVLRPSHNSSKGTFTTEPIVVRNGVYDDIDTPRDELEISFKWYVNGELVPGQNSNVLPARTAFYPDELLVSMVVSDGINVVESAPWLIVLDDSPEEIVATNLALDIATGDSLFFNVQLSDPDKPNNSPRLPGTLISAPDGATFNDNGDVSWQAPNEILLPQQTFIFTFETINLNNNLTRDTTLEIEVQAKQTMPLARKSSAVPINNASLAIGDFTGDGLNEILSTDSLSTVILFESTLGSDKTIWTYPFKVGKGSIVQVLAANVDADDALEIIVVSENSISIIYDLDEIAVELLSISDLIRFAQIADTNKDGILEIAYLLTSNNIDNSDVLVIRTLTAPSTEIITIPIDDVTEIAFGNVDEDSNIELVTNKGSVYDTSTWKRKWFNDNEFSDNTIYLADVNGNGIDEIIGADTFGDLTVYSAVDQVPLAKLENTQGCSLTAANVDNDNADEIILGDCQRDRVSAYDLVGDKLEEIWSTSTQNYGSRSLISGDSDNDGELEVHWASGIGSSATNSMVSVDLDTTLGAVNDRGEAPSVIEVTSHSSAGWANITPDNEQTVFFLQEDRGSRLAYMDTEGKLEFSEAISTNFDNSNNAITTDFNKDNFGDIFLPITEFQDGAVGAMQISNMQILWQTTATANTTIGMIRAQDINGDGYDDAIFDEGNSIRIVDVFRQIPIATLSTDSVIDDFVVLDISGQIVFVVAHSENIILYSFNDTSFSEISRAEQTCDQLTVFNNDNDPEQELLCLGNTNDDAVFKQSLIVYEIVSNILVETQKASLVDDVRSVAVDTSTSTEQKLFLAINVVSETVSQNFEENSFIVRASSNAKFTWRSPMLIGSANDASIKLRVVENEALEIQYATDQMMYWFK